MKEPNQDSQTGPRRHSPFLRIFVIATGLLVVGNAGAAIINSNGNDSSSQGSFSNGTRWTGGLAPSAGNDYVVVSSHLIRTLNDSVSRVFAGDSLSITANGGLLVRGNIDGLTTTVNDLILNNGALQFGTTASGSEVGRTTNFAGNISVESGGGRIVSNWGSVSTGTTMGANLTANISGSGLLSFFNSNASGNAYTFAPTLSGTNNYSGGTVVTGNAIATYKLLLNVDSTLGNGNVTVNPGANGALTLQLNNASTLADGSTLTLGGSTLVTSSNLTFNLNFTGGDTISSLVYNGVTYGSGTYGSVASGAENVLSGFAGTGYLVVVPEPAAGVMFLGALGMLAVLRRRK